MVSEDGKRAWVRGLKVKNKMDLQESLYIPHEASIASSEKSLGSWEIIHGRTFKDQPVRQNRYLVGEENEVALLKSGRKVMFLYPKRHSDASPESGGEG